jgi:hypothetical protein
MPVHSAVGGAKVVVSGSRGNDETGVGDSVGCGADDVSAGEAMLSFCKGDELEWRSRAVFHHVRWEPLTYKCLWDAAGVQASLSGARLE